MGLLERERREERGEREERENAKEETSRRHVRLGCVFGHFSEAGSGRRRVQK